MSGFSGNPFTSEISNDFFLGESNISGKQQETFTTDQTKNNIHQNTYVINDSKNSEFIQDSNNLDQKSERIKCIFCRTKNFFNLKNLSKKIKIENQKNFKNKFLCSNKENDFNLPLNESIEIKKKINFINLSNSLLSSPSKDQAGNFCAIEESKDYTYNYNDINSNSINTSYHNCNNFICNNCFPIAFNFFYQILPKEILEKNQIYINEMIENEKSKLLNKTKNKFFDIDCFLCNLNYAVCNICYILDNRNKLKKCSTINCNCLVHNECYLVLKYFNISTELKLDTLKDNKKKYSFFIDKLKKNIIDLQKNSLNQEDKLILYNNNLLRCIKKNFIKDKFFDSKNIIGKLNEIVWVNEDKGKLDEIEGELYEDKLNPKIKFKRKFFNNFYYFNDSKFLKEIKNELTKEIFSDDKISQKLQENNTEDVFCFKHICLICGEKRKNKKNLISNLSDNKDNCHLVSELPFYSHKNCFIKYNKIFEFLNHNNFKYIPEIDEYTKNNPNSIDPQIILNDLKYFNYILSNFIFSPIQMNYRFFTIIDLYQKKIPENIINIENNNENNYDNNKDNNENINEMKIEGVQILNKPLENNQNTQNICIEEDIEDNSTKFQLLSGEEKKKIDSSYNNDENCSVKEAIKNEFYQYKKEHNKKVNYKCTCFDEVLTQYLIEIKKDVKLEKFEEVKKTKEFKKWVNINSDNLKICLNDKHCANRIEGLFCSSQSCSNPKYCYNKVNTIFDSSKLFLAKKEKSNLGLFSGEEILKGEYIIQFTGEIINYQSFQNLDFAKLDLFKIRKISKNFYINANDSGNYSRFINHSCNPNCGFKNILKVISGKNINHYHYIFSNRNISPNEELTIDYNNLFEGQKIQNVIGFKCFCKIGCDKIIPCQN